MLGNMAMKQQKKVSPKTAKIQQTAQKATTRRVKTEAAPVVEKKKPAKPKAEKAAKPSATRTTAAKKAPKVSVLREVSVGDYINKLPIAQGQAVRMLCGMISRAVPDAQAVIKWAQPVFEVNGPFAYVKPAKNHLTFGFWRGAELDDPYNILQGTGQMRHVRLSSAVDAGNPALISFVVQAAALNRAKGNPTKGLNKEPQ